jgi:RNA polymerase primary sigma factor/RNA polymerase sporulation-specific sigma factor
MNKYNTLKEREILKLHYGWDNSKCMTLEEIGEIFNITGQQIRQSEVRAMRKIRQTPWGRKKSIELFKEKLLRSEYNSSPGVIDKINFASRYLN